MTVVPSVGQMARAIADMKLATLRGVVLEHARAAPLPDYPAACRALVEAMADGGDVDPAAVLPVLSHLTRERRQNLLEVLVAALVIDERNAEWLREETTA